MMIPACTIKTKTNMKQTILFLVATLFFFSSCKKENNKIHYTVDENTSKVEWKGYLMSGYFNRGTFSVAPTTLKAKGGQLQTADFTIPILSLNVLNLEGAPKGQLEAHLKSPDFFNILVHPNAYFKLTKLRPYQATVTDGVIEGANYEAEGNFTMLGVTKKIVFPAKISITDAAIDVAALLQINRLDWGMQYASDPAAGEHYILPTVDLHLQIHATKN
jgi:polyisoprenoid-binding protein YceI